MEKVRPPTFREIKDGLFDGFGFILSSGRVIRFAEGEGWNIVTIDSTGKIVKEELHLTEEVADAEIRLQIARRRQRNATARNKEENPSA